MVRAAGIRGSRVHGEQAYARSASLARARARHDPGMLLRQG